MRRYTILKGAKARYARLQMMQIDLAQIDLGFSHDKKGEYAFNAWIRETFKAEIAAGGVVETRPQNKVSFKGFASPEKARHVSPPRRA